MLQANLKYLAFIIFSVMLIISCGKKEESVNIEEVKKMEKEFVAFADSIEQEAGKLYTEMCTAYWDASISGKDEDFNKSAQAEIKWNTFLSNKELFAKVKKYKETNLIKSDTLARRLNVMYLTLIPYQIDTAKLNKMTLLQNEITKKFQTFRAKVDKKELTDNEVEDILSNSKNSKELEKVWLAHKEIGPLVAEDIIKLVKMRNEVAKELGFKNYHEMSLKVSEQDPEEILKLFDELDSLTHDNFATLIKDINQALAQQLKIKPDELRPWHYQNRYFQEAPKIYEVDLDKYYKNQDVVKLTEIYYKSIGLPIDDILAKSDLFEKKGKNQHAYCIDIDRNTKDVRVLCNVKPNQKWMSTMLHELGHGVYFKYHDPKLPWILKTPAHTFTTEAIAMLFGRMASNPQWMLDMKVIDAKEKEKIAEVCAKYLRLEQLVFSRWSQVMFRFEKSLYENPDQDLNKLWWDLVEKYQMIKKPEGRNAPDWATKIHIATSPCYYHNYHLGELLASQLYFYIKDKVLNMPNVAYCSFFDKPEAGKFLDEKVFKPGALYQWNDMIEKATGEKLTAKYYAKQFVK